MEQWKMILSQIYPEQEPTAKPIRIHQRISPSLFWTRQILQTHLVSRILQCRVLGTDLRDCPAVIVAEQDLCRSGKSHKGQKVGREQLGGTHCKCVRADGGTGSVVGLLTSFIRIASRCHGID